MLLQSPEEIAVMQQPESKFKEKLADAFCDLVGGQRHPDSFFCYIIASPLQKAGLPDQYFTALGGHAWVEAKVHPNTVSAIQMANMTRMRRGGSRVLIMTVNDMKIPEEQRIITVTELSKNSSPWLQTDYRWERMSSLAFWAHVLGVARA